MNRGSPQGPVACLHEQGNLPVGFAEADFFSTLMTINKMVYKSYIYFTVRILKDFKVYENFHEQHSHAK
jgi:hypothetical protein